MGLRDQCPRYYVHKQVALVAGVAVYILSAPRHCFVAMEVTRRGLEKVSYWNQSDIVRRTRSWRRPEEAVEKGNLNENV